MKLKIYTDGACSGNPGKGGWAAIILDGNNQSQISGSENKTTNNRMELMAAIMALKKIKKESDITIYTDSRYVKDGITEWIKKWKINNWKSANKKPVKNKGIGVDIIPKSIRNSTILTGNNLGQLGNIEILPQEVDVRAFLKHHRIESIFNDTSDAFERRELIHHYAKELLELGKVEKAWKALLVDGLNTIKEKKD